MAVCFNNSLYHFLFLKMEEKDAPVVVPAIEPAVEQPKIQSAVDVRLRPPFDSIGSPARGASACRCEERFRSPSGTKSICGNPNVAHATGRWSR